MSKPADDVAMDDSLRLRDLKLTIEVLVEALIQEARARERVALRHGIQKSVITDRIARIERIFAVELFTGPQRKTPTAAGKAMATYGPRLIEELSFFREIVRDASCDDTLA